MGGATPIARERGGRKSLDASMNLVPFIDLLSCCISFLLITAVWTQLSRFNTSVSGGATESVAHAPPPPRVLVSRDGYTLTPRGGDSIAIPKLGDAFDDARLGKLLRDEHARNPEDAALVVHGDDGTRYHEIVRAMDLAESAGYPDVSIDGS